MTASETAADMAVLLVTWMWTFPVQERGPLLVVGYRIRSCRSTCRHFTPRERPRGPAKRDKKRDKAARIKRVVAGRRRVRRRAGPDAFVWLLVAASPQSAGSHPGGARPAGRAARDSRSERSRPTSVVHRGGSPNGSPRRSPYPRRSGAISSMRHVPCAPRTVCDSTPVPVGNDAGAAAPGSSIHSPLDSGNRLHERCHTIRRPKQRVRPAHRTHRAAHRRRRAHRSDRRRAGYRQEPVDARGRALRRRPRTCRRSRRTATRSNARCRTSP